MFTKTLATVASFALLAGAASAKTYSIDGFVNSSANGFGSTLFHEATGCNRMCGSTIVKATGEGSGYWNDITGDISFVMDLIGGGTATVNGQLNFAGLATASDVVGEFHTTFAGTSAITGTHTLQFEKKTFNAAAGVNAFQNGIIGLWGWGPSAGGTPAQGGSGFYNGPVGADFRIQVSPVPIPASGLLLLTALGGIGFAGRRSRKKTQT